MDVIEIRSFYKVVALSVGTFETTIACEEHFSTLEDAQIYANNNIDRGFIFVIIKM